MERKKKIQQLTLAAFFVALQVVMTLTPIGYIPIGALSITTMHIPVILAGMILGKKFGGWIGFVFGLTSLVRATMQPSITSFVFSPFITIAGVSGNYASLLIVFLPRILLGYLAGALYEITKHYFDQNVAVMLTASICTLLHSILVLGGIYIFFGEIYAQVCGIDYTLLGSFLLGVIGTNGILEMILAAIMEPILVKMLQPATKRMGLQKA